MSRLVRSLTLGSIGVLVALGGLPVASAQTYEFLGPNKCVNCHDHDDEQMW